MLEKIILKWFSGIPVIETESYVLFYKNHEEHIAWGMKGRTIAIDALIFLKTDEIPFTEISSHIFTALEEQELRTPSRVSCTWLVCSPRGGIYLYETLAVKEHLRHGKMKNEFLVVNTDDGTVCFGPGHINNKRYTERTKELLSNIRTMTTDEFVSNFGLIMDDCLNQRNS